MKFMRKYIVVSEFLSTLFTLMCLDQLQRDTFFQISLQTDCGSFKPTETGLKNSLRNEEGNRQMIGIPKELKIHMEQIHLIPERKTRSPF